MSTNVPAVQHTGSVETIDAVYRQRVLERDAFRLARSSFLPDWMRLAKDGRPRPVADIEADCMVIGMTATDLGIPFNLVTLQKMPVIKGSVDIMAQLLLGLVASRGHDAWVEESTMQKATVCLVNGRTGRKHSVTYTIEEAAKTPQYKANPCWTTNPGDMLVARAVRRVTKRGAPEVLMSFPEAFADDDSPMVVDGGEAIEPAPWDALPPAPASPPATDEVRKQLGEHIQKLTTDQRNSLVTAWQRMSLPPLPHPDFDTTHAVDAAMLILEAKDASAKEQADTGGGVNATNPAPPEAASGVTRAPETGMGKVSTAAGEGSDVRATGDAKPSPERPSSDDRPLPLGAQLANLAKEAGVDHHNVIAAVTDGAQTSSKALVPREARRVIEALQDIKNGDLVLVQVTGGGWALEEPGALGEPFTE